MKETGLALSEHLIPQYPARRQRRRMFGSYSIATHAFTARSLIPSSIQLFRLFCSP